MFKKIPMRPSSKGWPWLNYRAERSLKSRMS